MSRVWILVLLFGLFAAVRMTAPTDLLEGDQEKQVGYVMDILLRGDWLVQYEISGMVATKPPAYNWVAAGICQVFQTRAEWAMKLPSLLAAAGLVTCIYLLGLKFFDDKTAFYASLACIASHHFTKLAWFARTDMLVAFTLYLAMTLLVWLRPTYRKSLLLGLVMGFSALTKGPVGPLLFSLFLLAWSWREQTLTERRVWLRFIPGFLLFALILGSWLACVWAMPMFQDRVIYWQLGSRMTEARLVKPVYYYVTHLLTRIAPWTFVAIVAAWRARSRDEWPAVRFTLFWGALFFLTFSLTPIKRHDHLFPVYPAVFLLAGLGLRYAWEPLLAPDSRWLLYPVAAGLVLTPLAILGTSQPAVWLLAAAAAGLGVIAFYGQMHQRRWGIVVAASGMLCVHGVYHHWGYQVGRADYDDLAKFVQEVREQTNPDERVIIFQAHPLIAYELGQHEPLGGLDQLAAQEGQWLIAPYYWREDIQGRTQWKLEEQAAMQLHPRAHQATLYRIVGTPPLQSAAVPPEQKASL